MLYFFLFLNFVMVVLLTSPLFQKKAMPENFQTSWNRNKGNADWYSQLLSALNDSEVKIK